VRVLVTGGLGFLGCNVADELASTGHEIVVFDNFTRVGATRNLAWLEARHSLQSVAGDVRSRDDVMRVVRMLRPDRVIHLAGQVAMTTSISDPRTDFEVNVLGTLNVLEALRLEVPDARILYSSTNKVYGDLDAVETEEHATRYVAPAFLAGFDESMPLDFRSPYGCSKGAADQYVLDYSRVFGVRGLVFRHSSMCGGRQFATVDQGWVGWFCQQALEQASSPDSPAFTIAGSGKQVRDVLHADDMRRLYSLALDAPDDAWDKAYNIGGGMANSLSLLELFKLLEELLGVTLRFERLQARRSDQRIFVADTGRAEGAFDWSPLVGAGEAIRRVISWLASEDYGRLD
jgi:CDP-paratose 2-epimerase